MPSSVITIDELADDLERIGRDDKRRAHLAMRTAAELMKTEAVQQIQLVGPHKPVDTGTMARSYIVEPTVDGAILENTSPYAAHMEYGTRPGSWTPLGALYLWAERKLRGTVSGPARKRRAFALARGAQLSIFHHGIAARGFHAAALGKTDVILRKAILMHFKGSA